MMVCQFTGDEMMGGKKQMIATIIMHANEARNRLIRRKGNPAILVAWPSRVPAISTTRSTVSNNRMHVESTVTPGAWVDSCNTVHPDKIMDRETVRPARHFIYLYKSI